MRGSRLGVCVGISLGVVLAGLQSVAHATSMGGIGSAPLFLGALVGGGAFTVGALVTSLHNGLNAPGEGPPISTGWAVAGYTFGGLAVAAGAFNLWLSGGTEPVFLTFGISAAMVGVASIGLTLWGQLRAQPVGTASGAQRGPDRRGSFFSLPTLRF